MPAESPEIQAPARPLLARDELGRLLPGQSSLNPSGKRADGTTGRLSIRETIRAYLEDNPEEMRKVINHFIKHNPEFMWNMMEVAPPKGTVVMNPDGTNIGESSNALLELTKKINEIHGEGTKSLEQREEEHMVNRQE